MNKKSGHWQNTGLAKWISDNLYQYNTSDEKSMNPMKWYSIQNGGNLNDTRETINGFPCRLILINDGETPLNEGQNEPTPGNVKDMGIFNFNNDKGNTDTFGLDNSIFPRCVSYEVVANSDTSAGAFVPFLYKKRIGFKKNGGEYNTGQIPVFLPKGITIKYECPVSSVIRYFNNGTQLSQVAHENTIAYTNITVPSNATHMFFVMYGSVPSEIKFDGVPYECAETAIASTSLEELYTEADELAYLQDSFELRYPDDKVVGADYGFLGMNVHVKNMFIDYVPIDVYQIYTTAVTPDYYGSEITVETDNGRYFKLRYYYPNDWDTETSSYDSGSTVTLKANRYVSIVCSPSTKYLIINGTKYTIGNETTMSEIRKNPYEGDGEEIVFSSEYGLKRVIDWVGNATNEEFVANFEQYFNKEYTFRYYLLVIALG